MDIQELRRDNLRRWTQENGVPAKEKSFFSQLLGGASFGERAARRLESTYGMGAGYLDSDPNGSMVPVAPSPSSPKGWDQLRDDQRRAIEELIATMLTGKVAMANTKPPKDGLIGD
ncbi:hypothetical protein [Burkholderia gladioli]|uniref:hypothetical protein n=1 Tax=Burkholderia gladioli TaxID=28095 RepID=UPI00163ED55C|nr:hypothetical protein [Burkholderia gladioli]